MREHQTAPAAWRWCRGAKALRCLVIFAICLVLPHHGAGATQAKETVEQAIADLLELRPGMVVAEIGAGNGDLAVRLAGLVGRDGRVYANEIDPAMIQLMKKKKASGNVANLTVVLGEETDPVLPEQADRILLAWVYHHLSRPEDFMAGLSKYLKSDGWLAVVAVDVRFTKEGAAEKDPCVSDPAVVQAAIEKAGFAFHGLKYLQGYPELYMLTFERTRLAARADGSARDSQGRTPLDLAVRYGNRRVADALRVASVTAATSPPAKPTALGPAPKMGEAVVWYLGHMGWAVWTANHFMVFDYDGRGVPPDEPSLANGSIDPNQIKDLSTTVFITHSHTDHYAPAVFDWKKTVKDITYVAGFKPEGKEGYGFMAPRETKTLGGLNITTTRANDEGVGFFVKADGVTIFHSGDHSARAGDESFKSGIDFLAGRGLRADLLFMPVSPVNDTVMNQGVHYAMKQLSAGAVFPGHVGGREDVYREFARDSATAGMKAPIHCPEFPGDHFAVDGRLRAQLKQAEAWEADRDRTHQIDKALDGLGLRPGMIVAEVGAGPGYLVEKLARRVGPGGRVYAEDITARMLEMLKLRMADRQLANFETILGAETDPKLPAGGLDMVIICSTMHMVASPVELLRTVVPSLKPGGRLVLIEPVLGQAADPQGRAIADSHFRTREAYLKIFAEASLAVERIDATTLPFDTVFVLAPAARQHGAADAVCVTTVERR